MQLLACCAGVKLLQRMGWRQGKGVGPSRAPADEPASKKSRCGPQAHAACSPVVPAWLCTDRLCLHVASCNACAGQTGVLTQLRQGPEQLR